jgi:dCTP deaminase
VNQRSNVFGYSRILVDADYKRMGGDLLQPFSHAQIQPASYDVRLGSKILRPKPGSVAHPLDLRTSRPADLMEADDIGDHYILRSNECALVATQELVTCPPDMVCSVEGKSTLARCFIAVHSTAGFVDPGYVGTVTLELTNHGPWDFVLYTGMFIAQLRFHWLGITVERPYGSPALGSHYQGATQVKAAEGMRGA